MMFFLFCHPIAYIPLQATSLKTVAPTLQLAFSLELMALDNNSPVQLPPSSVSNSPATPAITPPATPGSSVPPATPGAGGDPPAVQPVTPPAVPDPDPDSENRHDPNAYLHDP
ncbi:hypothetical protein GQ55_4G100300 [Panicum hallii var. hallii]|uniref:Uncharacterized protein n=1 Tax=Panicum hallii var. hallii TaxID=1504633 RepID=A0A2T7DX39_9POAL|nr:hypothetical protein GQ55_4G100300 [Panicum hallii var. hallii]